MNLVIDDAVEVKQATKTDEEKRRELGIDASRRRLDGLLLTFEIRPDTPERRQCLFNSGATIISRLSNGGRSIEMSRLLQWVLGIPRKSLSLLDMLGLS